MSDVEAFLKNTWGDKLERKETLSGSGSTMANTQNIRRELPLLIKKYSVTSMFDVPCGDGNWISNVELNCSYVGGDLVSSFVSSAKRKELNVYDFDLSGDHIICDACCRICCYQMERLMWRYPWGPHFQASLMPGDRISNLRSAGTIVPSVFR